MVVDGPRSRYCSKTAATQLFFTNFFHSLGTLSGFKDIIDTKLTPGTDHYRALERKKQEASAALDGMRWSSIQLIMESQESSALLNKNQIFNENLRNSTGNVVGVDKASVDTLIDLKQFIEKQQELNEKSIHDKLNLYNFSAIVNTFLLYGICFVLLTFVKWN